jgi:pantoate kinase
METDTDFSVTRSITLTEADWLAITAALRRHANTQEVLGWEHTAANARKLAELLKPPSTREVVEQTLDGL